MTCPLRLWTSQRRDLHKQWVTTTPGPESVFSKRRFLCHSSAPVNRSRMNGSGRLVPGIWSNSRLALLKRKLIVTQGRAQSVVFPWVVNNSLGRELSEQSFENRFVKFVAEHSVVVDAEFGHGVSSDGTCSIMLGRVVNELVHEPCSCNRCIRQ